MSGTRRAPAPLADPAPETLLVLALRSCRRQFWVVGLFSGVVNLLQLTVSIYMMQVFDRVLSTRSVDTLYYLTLITVAAVGLLALLEATRAQVMHRVAAWVEHKVAPEGFARAVAQYLDAETRAVGEEIEVLTAYGPFRRCAATEPE